MMTNRCRQWLTSLAVLILAVVGCDDRPYSLAPVSGTVTLDGAPLADAMVGFEPKRQGKALRAGPGAYGPTDAEGKFTLKTLHKEPGAVVGPHTVMIRTARDTDREDGKVEVLAKERLPIRHNDRSELTFTVPGNGTDAANFDLTSKSKASSKRGGQ